MDDASAWDLILGGDPALFSIVRLSLTVSLSATLFAAILGAPLGALIALTRNRSAGSCARSYGMMLGNLGPRWGSISEAGDRVVRSTWEFITFLANSLVFLLIGLAEGREHFGGLWWTASAALIATLAGRMAAVYPLCGLFSRGRNRVAAAQQHALVWGGLRGALAIALVLSISESYPWRRPIVVVTFAVVAFSIIVQGLNCRPLLRRACGTDTRETSKQ